MPLWRIFAHPDTFSYEQRKAIAAEITKLYSVLPAFYVNVIFIDVKEEQVWIGGEPKKNFVRIAIEQIARSLPSPESEDGKRIRPRWMKKINEALKPFLQDLEWELHIYETPRDLWLIQGMEPPPSNSEAENLWKATNKPHPYEKL